LIRFGGLIRLRELYDGRRCSELYHGQVAERP
jgi:hypothetical protein